MASHGLHVIWWSNMRPVTRTSWQIVAPWVTLDRMQCFSNFTHSGFNGRSLSKPSVHVLLSAGACITAGVVLVVSTLGLGLLG